MNAKRSSSRFVRQGSSKAILRTAIMATPAIAAILGFEAPVRGADTSYYWDINGTAAGSAGNDAPAGTWNASNTFWTTDASGTSGHIAWVGAGTSPDRNIAVFSAGANGTGAYTVTVSGTQAVDGITAEEGALTLSGGTLNLAATNPTIVNQGGGTNSTRLAMTINSTITGTSGATFDLLANGVTTFTLGGNNSGWTGKIILARGSGTTSGLPNNYVELVPTHDNALGASGAGNEIDFSTPGASGNYSRVRLTGSRIINKNIIIRGGGDPNGSNGYGNLHNSGGTNTWSGDIYAASGSSSSNNTGATIASTSGTLVVTGVIRNGTDGTVNGFWTKTGAGTVALANTNTFTQFIRHMGGTLELRANGALGPAMTAGKTAGSTVINPHETGPTAPIVAFRGGFSYDTYEVISLSARRSTGTPLVEATGINNAANNNTFGGDIRFGAVNQGVGQTVGAASGSSLEFKGKLWAAEQNTARIISKIGAGEIIISGANTTADGVQDGAGTTYDADQYSLNSGTFIVSAGTLTIRGASGSLSGGMNFVVSPTGLLKLDSSLGGNSNRVADTASIELNASSEARVIGHATTAINETAGKLTTTSGFSTLTVQSGGAAVTLNLTDGGNPGYVRGASRSTTLIRGVDGVGSVLTATGAVPLLGGGGGAGSPTIGIVPELVGDSSATGGGSDFVTVVGGVVRPLAAGEAQPLSSGLTDTVNTTVAAGTTISADTAVNSLKISGGNTLTIDPGRKLVLRSGALLGVGTGSSLSGGMLAFEDSTISTDPESGVTSLVGTSAEGIITVPTGGTMSVSSALIGGLGLTKSGGGTLTLGGTNLYGTAASGQTTLNAGVLAVSQDANLGDSTAKVVFAGGTLRATASHSTSRSFELNSTVSNSVDVSTGAVYTHNGVISGGRLTKVGAGDLVLAGGNSYTGGTSIQAGQVSVASSAPLSSGSVALDGGSLHLTASTTYTNLVSVNNTAGGFRVDPGVTAIWNGVISGSSNVRFDGGGTFNPTANMTYSGNNLVSNGSTLRYTVATGLGDLSGTQVGHFTLDSGRLQVVGQSSGGIASFATSRGITVNAGGGTIDVQQGTATAPYALTIAQVVAGSGHLNVNTDSNSLAILTGNNTYSGGTTINGTLRLTGSGDLGTPGHVVNNGSLQVHNANSLGDISGPGSTTVGTGTTGVIVAANHFRQASLTVSANSTAKVNATASGGGFAGGQSAGTSKLTALSLAAGAKLDLGNNKLVTSSAIGSHNGTNYTGILGLVEQGRNGGSWDGAGITTSMPEATGGSGYTVLGVATASEVRFIGSSDTDIWGGQTVTGSDSLVMYTYGGDANLSGNVDIDDYTQIDSNASLGGVLTGWINGDFDYNGISDIDDYTIIDSVIGIQGDPFATASPANGMTIAAVPEPVVPMGLVLMAAACGRRKRRTPHG